MSLAIAVLAVLAAISIAMLILNNLRRHKRMLAVMTVKNEAISRHEAQLERLLQELDEKNKEKDRILRVVAHDLRSPVGGIKMMTGLLLKNSESKQAEMISFIRRSAINCLDLVNELLAGGFSGEAIVPDRSVFDLKQLVEESAQLMQFNAAEKGQVIDAVLPEGKQPILADAAKIGRVLNNILGNAIKFSPTGSGIIVTLTIEGRGYRIAIRDHGMGIPAAEQKNVFEVFTLSRRPGTQGEKSFGLGLSISKQIVEAHEGRIWFESEEGKGTEFFIELPAVV
jgi:signal transduction histidine kinase